MTKATVSSWETNRSMPSVDIVLKLAGLFGVRVDLLLTDSTVQLNQSNYSGLANDKTIDYLAGNVLVVRNDATTNQGITYEPIKVPGITGEARTFRINENNMEPVLIEGDFVTCKRVEEYADIRDGQIYAVVTRNQDIHIGYLQETGSALKCLFQSDEPRHLVKDDVLEVWLVHLRITPHLFSLSEIGGDPQLKQRLENVEQFLKSVFPQFK